MKRIIVLLLFCTSSLLANTPIVFVHLGRMVPGYYATAIEQAHLFNPESPIYLIIHAQAEKQLLRKKRLPSYTKLVIAQHLPPTEKHISFTLKPYRTMNDGMLKFWRYSMERFFLLEEFMEAYGIEEAVHLEGDNLLYAELDQMVPNLRSIVDGVALPFLHDDECVPSFVYIKNRESLGRLTSFLEGNVIGEGHRSDMTLLALFAKEEGVACLPAIPSEYIEEHAMVSLNGKKAKHPNMYGEHADFLQCLFDPAPIGQYLDGESAVHKNRRASFINENSVYNASLLPLTWHVDSKGRRVPYLAFQGKLWPLVNLHIHSKNLYKFAQGVQ